MALLLDIHSWLGAAPEDDNDNDMVAQQLGDEAIDRRARERVKNEARVPRARSGIVISSLDRRMADRCGIGGHGKRAADTHRREARGRG